MCVLITPGYLLVNINLIRILRIWDFGLTDFPKHIEKPVIVNIIMIKAVFLLTWLESKYNWCPCVKRKKHFSLNREWFPWLCYASYRQLPWLFIDILHIMHTVSIIVYSILHILRTVFMIVCRYLTHHTDIFNCFKSYTIYRKFPWIYLDRYF